LGGFKDHPFSELFVLNISQGFFPLNNFSLRTSKLSIFSFFVGETDTTVLEVLQEQSSHAKKEKRKEKKKKKEL